MPSSALRGPGVTASTGYPDLSAADPPAYGILNPRPSAADIQNGAPTSMDTGPLYGEYFNAEADSSLFQPNIAPDVVTVVVVVPKQYFPDGISEIFIPQGTPVLLNRNPARRDKQIERAVRDTGCVHVARFGNVLKMKQFTDWVNPPVDEDEVFGPLASAFGTFLVGPATARKGKLLYMAVAVQNVCHVSFASIHKDERKDVRPGDAMALCFDNNQRSVVVCKDSTATNAETPGRYVIKRELTSVLPLDSPQQGTVTMDLHRILIWEP